MSKAKALNSIVGLFVLTFRPGRRVQYQGKIAGTDGDDVIVSLFEWACGYPSGGIALLNRSELYDSDRVQLFHDEEAWREEGTRQSRLNYERIKVENEGTASE